MSESSLLLFQARKPLAGTYPEAPSLLDTNARCPRAPPSRDVWSVGPFGLKGPALLVLTLLGLEWAAVCPRALAKANLYD